MNSKLKILAKGAILPLALAFTFVFSGSVNAAPHNITGTISKVKNITLKDPYNWKKPTKNLYIANTIYVYMVVNGLTKFHGISYDGCKAGVKVQIKSRPEPPGMVGKPISQIRASRYGACEYALDVWKK